MNYPRPGGSAPVTYPTGGWCRHGRNPCPDFWCGQAGREAGRQTPETRGDQDATPVEPPT